MKNALPAELEQAWELLNEGKLQKGLEIVLLYEQKGISYEDKDFECEKVKLFLLLRSGRLENALKLAEQTYNEAMNVKNYYMAIYCDLIKFTTIIQAGKNPVINNYIEKCENLLKLISDEKSEEFILGEIFIDFIRCHLYIFSYNFELAIIICKKSLKALQNYPKFSFLNPTIQMYLGTIYNRKGELNNAIFYQKEALQLTKGDGFTPNHIRLSCMLNLGVIYTRQAKFDQALLQFKRALSLALEKKINHRIHDAYYFLIDICVKKKSIDQARKYLAQMEETEFIHELDDYDETYKLAKATILKESGRFTDLAEAIGILRNIIPHITASYLLCELLLKELRISGDPEILTELEKIIEELLELGEKSKSFDILAQVHLFQAQIALIQMKINESKHLLTKAEKIASDHGLSMIAQMISDTHDKVLDQEEMWIQLKNSNAPIAERLKISSIDEILDKIMEKTGLIPPKVETEQPILLAVISNDGKMIVSVPFSSEMVIDDFKISQLVKTITSLSTQLFSESVERIKIGENTMLFTNINPLSICYLIRGQSYNASIKLNNFIEALRENKAIFSLLIDASINNQRINIKDYDELEFLITEYFISGKNKFELPFIAYNGEDPFIFVSYSHSNKLQVYPIMDYLNKSGLNIWYDEGISISEDWKKSIVNNIEKCTVFLVFITPQVIDSEYVKKEISFALSRKKPFYSVYLKETKLPAELEFDMAGIQSMKKYIMLDNEFYEKIKENLKTVIKKKIDT